MAKLILSMDNLVLKEIPLNKERTTLGRKAHNDIQIDNLAVSGEHAVIVSILNDSFLEDLNSTNGTFVNGQQIKKHFLQNNDVIELGKYRLKYINEAPQHATQADFEKTMVLRPDMLRKPAEPAAAKPPTAASPPAAPPAAAPQPPLGAVQILTGSNAGRQLELTKSLTTLGRPGVQVAVIARRPIGYFLTHVEGARYPLVNGAAIHTQAHELKDHDVIELAGVKMEFFLKG
ncbi:MAG: FHA domain-containing protein [Rhodocyclaceae bacterium]|nr:FHA domain-containing protein [Rhodocyclaceae bacterium]